MSQPARVTRIGRVQRGHRPARDRLHDQEQRVDADPARQRGEERRESRAVVAGLRECGGLQGDRVGDRCPPAASRVAWSESGIAATPSSSPSRGCPPRRAAFRGRCRACRSRRAARPRRSQRMPRRRPPCGARRQRGRAVGDLRAAGGELVDLADDLLHAGVARLDVVAQWVEAREHVVDRRLVDARVGEACRDVVARLGQRRRWRRRRRRPRRSADAASSALPAATCSAPAASSADPEASCSLPAASCAVPSASCAAPAPSCPAPSAAGVGAVGELRRAVGGLDEAAADRRDRAEQQGGGLAVHLLRDGVADPLDGLRADRAGEVAVRVVRLEGELGLARRRGADRGERVGEVAGMVMTKSTRMPRGPPAPRRRSCGASRTSGRAAARRRPRRPRSAPRRRRWPGCPRPRRRAPPARRGTSRTGPGWPRGRVRRRARARRRGRRGRSPTCASR